MARDAMKAPEPTPESLEKAQDFRNEECPNRPGQMMVRFRHQCLTCVALFRDEAVRDTKERAAKLVDEKCAYILSRQLGGKDYEFTASVDQNLRMMAVLLPDLAAAIREV